MGNLAAVIRMVGQRSLGHWRLGVAMAFGAVLCAALLSAVALYSDTVRDLGLSFQLENQPEQAVDIFIQSTSQRFEPGEFDALVKTTNELVASRTDGFQRDVIQYGRSATFFPTAPGGTVPEDDGRPRAHFQFYDRLAEHVRLVEGGPLPVSSPAAEGSPPTIDVWIGLASAQLLDVTVGQEFDLHPHWRPVLPVRVRVVGIVEPIDSNDPYWYGDADRFLVAENSWQTYPFFAAQDSVVRAVGAYLPDMDGTLETYIRTDIGAIDSSNARSVEDRVRGLSSDVQARLTITRVETSLANVIESYREKLFFTRLPLFALMLQIVGIVLFYLVMVSTMVVDRQTGEIALLKSRGAGTYQVMTIFAIEGVGIALLATALGPLVAWGGISVLGLTPSFRDLSGGELLDIRLTPLAFGLAALGGVLALAALMIPAYRASRLSITNYKQQISRPPSQSAFLRYYLDLVLVAAGAFAFYQLRQRGSLLTESLFGDLSADPVLLATPTLFMLMVALVFLRLFPLLLRALLYLSRPLNGPSVSVALTRMARSPLQHSRLILLLILATAVGMFAAGFRSTLERGYEDRASYAAGAELRISDIRQPGPVPGPTLVEQLERVTGATQGTAVIRIDGSYNSARFTSERIDFLGIDAVGAVPVLLWREDYAAKSPGALLRDLEQVAVETPTGAAIPDGARFIGVWVQNPLPSRFSPMGVRLRDKDGAIWEYRLFTEREQDPERWQFYIADLTRPLAVHPAQLQPSATERKWTFDGFFLSLPGAPPTVSEQVTVLIDDLQAFAAFDSAALADEPGWSFRGLDGGTVVETFDDVSPYELIKGISQAGDPGVLARAGISGERSGAAARLSFIRGRGGSPLVSFRTIRDSRPLPVLADAAFLDRNSLEVGAEILMFLNSQYVTVRIAGTFDLFPTYDPETGVGLFVADSEALRNTATRMPGAGGNVYPNEVWFGSRGAAPVTVESLAERAVNAEAVFDRAALLQGQSGDPLIAASWEGILFLAFAAVLLVSALGFVTYASLGAQERSLEFAILRTMGLSGRQILAVVSFEQVSVVVAGMLAGTLLGFPLSRLMIDYMGITEEGRAPLPPLQSVVNWQTVGTVYALLGFVVASTVVALVALYSRLAVSRALRMGEL
ncbi:MAG: ABC transporter permease [Dehalococcoidia bacterium]